MSSGLTRDLLPGSAGWLLTTSIPVILPVRYMGQPSNMHVQSGTSGLNLWYATLGVTAISTRQEADNTQAEGVQQAFQLDSLRASHPIEVPVRNALEVDQIFDHISYLKGSSVIRMLSGYLGRETFLRGVADYLKTHAYGKLQ